MQAGPALSESQIEQIKLLMPQAVELIKQMQAIADPRSAQAAPDAGASTSTSRAKLSASPTKRKHKASLSKPSKIQKTHHLDSTNLVSDSEVIDLTKDESEWKI
jgi:hypothetical protein